MLISDEYRKQLENAHKEAGWGTTGQNYARITLGLSTGCSSILDYGCGKESLKQAINKLDPRVPVFGYDPAIPKVSKKPGRHDFVVSTDVFEHIEPEYLDSVLVDIRSIMKKKGLFVISTVKAIKILEDGRNAHLIIEPLSWWAKRLEPYFYINGIQQTPTEIIVTVK